ncbi:MAG: TonB-dependent receptor plug domain-containing protein, partial [Woeseiaceae bacterium]|nr:TonB-dependent receptor plug domain-containing protein [Woeseiaceae bacterium]
MKLLTKIFSIWILAAVTTAGMSIAMPAYAQSIIEEIIVTATKREENIGTVPVAVTAVSGSTIDSAGFTTLEGIQALVPSLSYGKGGTNRNSNLSLRGVGTISFAVGAEPGVSTVVDGVVLARQGQAFAELYDLERVEVLRGPQGTLFGKNASSGLINIISKGPTEEFEGGAEVSYYEDNELRVKGSVSGPISDKVQYRLNATYGNFDGFVKNAFNGEDIYGYDRWGVRGMLDFAPSDAVAVRVIAEHYETDDLCCSEVVIVDDGGIQADAFLLGGGIIDGAATRTTASNAVQRTENQGNALTVQLDWDFDNYTLTSVTGYRDWDNTERQDIDDTPFGASE